MGGDSAQANSYGHLTLIGLPKIFTRDDEFLFGGSGSIRMMDIIRSSFEIPEIQDDIDCYMRSAFITALRESFKEEGYGRKDNEQEEHNGFLMVGVRGRLYVVEPDYHIRQTQNNYDAIGSASDVALGALAALQHYPDLSPEHMLRIALEASEVHNVFVRAPFYVDKLCA